MHQFSAPFFNQHDKINVTMYNQGSFSSMYALWGQKKGPLILHFELGPLFPKNIMISIPLFPHSAIFLNNNKAHYMALMINVISAQKFMY